MVIVSEDCGVGIQHSHERYMKSKAQDLNCGAFTCTEITCAENYKMKMSTQPIALHYKEEYLLSILFKTHIHKSTRQVTELIKGITVARLFVLS